MEHALRLKKDEDQLHELENLDDCLAYEALKIYLKRCKQLHAMAFSQWRQKFDLGSVSEPKKMFKGRYEETLLRLDLVASDNYFGSQFGNSIGNGTENMREFLNVCKGITIGEVGKMAIDWDRLEQGQVD
jgi:hypothetical protein